MKNNHNGKNIIGVLALLALFLLGVYFFIVNKFSTQAFLFYIFGISVVIIALICLDRLKELDLKNLKLVLDEIKETRKDIYAKAAEVNKILESLAENYIYSATQTGRILGGEFSLQRDMIKKRDMAKYLLKKAGWSDAKIFKKIDRINQMIFRDIILNIESKAYKVIDERETERRRAITGRTYISKLRGLGEIDPDFIRLVNEARTDDETITNIKKYLENHVIDLEIVKNDLEQLEYFLKEKRLL